MRQVFNDTLNPGQRRWVEFSATITPQSIHPTFACVSIERLLSLNDANPLNDRYCLPLQADAWVHLYPNPFTDQLYLELTLKEDEDVTIELFDMQGRTMQRWQTVANEEGYFRTPLALSALPAGQYVLAVTTNSRSERRLVQKI
jgi:hypothetical protein